jgi:hypothetical protein
LKVQASDQDGNQAGFPLTIEFSVALPWFRRPSVLVVAGAALLGLVLMPVLALRWRSRAERGRRILCTVVGTLRCGLVAADGRGRIVTAEGYEIPGLGAGRSLAESHLGRRLAAMSPGAREAVELGGEKWDVAARQSSGRRLWLLTLLPEEERPRPPDDVLNQAEALAGPASEAASPEVFRADLTIEAVLRELPPEAAGRVKLLCPVPATVWHARGRQQDFAEILRALVTNGLESAEEARVSVLARNRRMAGNGTFRCFVEVEVLDDGPGVAGLGWKVYRPLFTTKEGHRGLGLTMALGLARRSGAILQVDNRPERGTRALLLFPAQRP